MESEANLQQSIFSFHNIGLRDQIQVIRLDCKHLCPLIVCVFEMQMCLQTSAVLSKVMRTSLEICGKFHKLSLNYSVGFASQFSFKYNYPWNVDINIS